MGPFLSGFADELIKLGAFPQQHQDPGAYDSASTVQGAMDSAGLKSTGPVPTGPAQKKRAPTPLTSPNQMVDYASKS